jgi:hypothetical protein
MYAIIPQHSICGRRRQQDSADNVHRATHITALSAKRGGDKNPYLCTTPKTPEKFSLGDSPLAPKTTVAKGKRTKCKE